MEKVKVFIEREDDGTFSAVMDSKANLPYGLVGEGDTVADAIAEWNRAYEDMKALYAQEGEKFPEAEFTFTYDVASFLKYYAGRLSFKGLATLTGVSAAQLSQYASGYRHPSPKTALKIQTALNSFGRELSRVQLI